MQNFDYPLKLYLQRKTGLFFIAMSIPMMIGVGYFGLQGSALEGFEDYLNIVYASLFALVSLSTLIGGISVVLGISPNIEIHKQGICIHKLKKRQIPWRNISAIYFEPSATNNLPKQMLYRYQLKVIGTNGDVLTHNLDHMQCAEQTLNPKEVFLLILQAFNGQEQLQYHQVDMATNETINSKKNVILFIGSVVFLICYFAIKY